MAWTDPTFMGTRENCFNLLQRCFSREEWNWLTQEAEFQNALENVRGLDQTEDLIKLGLRLIYLARKGALPSGRSAPALLRSWR